MFVDKVIKTLKIYETKPNIVWFDFSGREHYNKDITTFFMTDFKGNTNYKGPLLNHYKKS